MLSDAMLERATPDRAAPPKYPRLRVGYRRRPGGPPVGAMAFYVMASAAEKRQDDKGNKGLQSGGEPGFEAWNRAAAEHVKEHGTGGPYARVLIRLMTASWRESVFYDLGAYRIKSPDVGTPPDRRAACSTRDLSTARRCMPNGEWEEVPCLASRCPYYIGGECKDRSLIWGLALPGAGAVEGVKPTLATYSSGSGQTATGIIGELAKWWEPGGLLDEMGYLHLGAFGFPVVLEIVRKTSTKSGGRAYPVTVARPGDLPGWIAWREQNAYSAQIAAQGATLSAPRLPPAPDLAEEAAIVLGDDDVLQHGPDLDPAGEEE